MLRSKELHVTAHRAIVGRDTLHLLAHADPLTGLPDRRELNNTLESLLQQATPDYILAVYMLDLDCFKQVNEQYGHDVGDELLIATEKPFNQTSRSIASWNRLRTPANPRFSARVAGPAWNSAVQKGDSRWEECARHRLAPQRFKVASFVGHQPVRRSTS